MSFIIILSPIIKGFMSLVDILRNGHITPLSLKVKSPSKILLYCQIIYAS